MGMRVPIITEMEDGRVLKAVCDQRDFAAAEGADIDRHTHVHTWVRYLAFAALTRTKQYGGSWEQFNTLDCIEASDVVVEESGDTDEGLDPGRKAPGDGS